MSKIIADLQDLTNLKWVKIRRSSGTAGSFLKSQDTINGKKIYYKLSNYDSFKGIVGHECINEIIADRILTILGIEHLEYTLIHANILLDDKVIETYLCASEDFKSENESKIALDVYYQMEANISETPMEFINRMGWQDYVYDMLLIDYLILNRDRHGANIEVLRNSKRKEIRLAPLFDHGLSLLFSAMDDDAIRKFDVNEKRNVQCFVGSNNTKENLQLVPIEKRKKIPAWNAQIENMIFNGLDGILNEELKNKMIEMISQRWLWYENFSN